MKTRSLLRCVVIALIFAISFSLVIPPAAARAATVYRVIPSGGKTSGDCGDTWANGCDLQYALATKAVAGEELWVKKGAYKPTATTDRAASFYLKNGVSIYGGFNGTEDELYQRYWSIYPTTLSGDIGAVGVNTDNSYHVVYANGSGISPTAVLDGFTIQDGYANGSLPDNNGGGMFNDHGSPTLSNLIFSNNQAGAHAGGMYNNSSHAILTNVRFENNTAGSIGGGMYEISSWITLNAVTFYGNHAGSAGGGIADVELSSSTLNNVTFTMNDADFGGGMYIDTYYPGQPPTLTDVTFIANSATSRGGGMYVYTSSPVLTNVIFTANSALFPGGAIGNYAGHLTLTNVSFSNNSAPANGGGAIFNFGSDYYGAGTALIRNSLLWGDTGGEISNDAASASTSTISYSIVQGCNPGGVWNSACGTNGGNNQPDVDPLFLDAAHNRLQLTQPSPAIDAGNDALVNPGETDVAGDPRIVGSHVDLGAYEFSLLYVDSRSTTGLNNGSSWANAYTNLQNALSAATHDSEVWVAKGIYKPTFTGNRFESFHLITGVMVYGGFAGTETARPQRNWVTNPTLLSGDLNGDDGPDFTNIADNSYFVAYAANVDSSAVLDGFTIIGGNGDNGGGMFITGQAYPTLNHLVFSKNKAAGSGGGLYIDSGCPSVANTTFIGNVANVGAGLNIFQACIRLTNVTFSGNAATARGGGMYSTTGNLVLDKVVFSGNSAIQNGGGMFLLNTSSELTSVVFTRNTASEGAGIYNTYGSSTRLTNVTFSGNSANPGHTGGIYNTSENTLVASTVSIRNSLLWGDSDGEVYNNPTGIPSTSNVTFSLAQGCNPGGAWTAACGANGGNNPVDADPRFVDAAQANLHLRTASPAIDKGNNAFITGGATDLDGNPRILNGTVDLGAYEYQNYSPLVANFTKSGASGQDVPFTLSDFKAHFSDANGDSLAAIRITALPGHGVLYLGAAAVTLNQQIPAGSIGSLHFTPAAQWNGTTSFAWNGSDGAVYASQVATVTLSILPATFYLFLPAIRK